jgi:hypothetical protein
MGKELVWDEQGISLDVIKRTVHTHCCGGETGGDGKEKRDATEQ